jgi:uncharacterized membrane protein YeaQ/YmgE (transglycosylase-associated protein family)
MMGWIGFIVFGLIIGALAKLVMPGRDSSPWWMTALLGMAGSVLATIVLRGVGHYGANQGAGWIASFAGAVVVVWLWRTLRK